MIEDVPAGASSNTGYAGYLGNRKAPLRKKRDPGPTRILIACSKIDALVAEDGLRYR